MRKTYLTYFPHGSSVKQFFKQTPDSVDWEEYQKFETEFREKHGVDFIIFWNNRNIRRKQPGDVILAFRHFCDQLPKEKSDRCVLFMKTHIRDENGTDLITVKKAICPKYKVIFHQEVAHPKLMNFFYNIADVTVSLSSAEGFGLSFNESLNCGTCVAGPVTGGLQDQMRFEDEDGNWINFNPEFTSNHRGKYTKCGEWAFPIFPKTRAMQGSIPTPYIFDDYCDAVDLSNRLLEIYNLSKEERDRRGLVGREWVTGTESMMSSPEMCNKFIGSIDKLLDVWQAPPKFEMMKFKEKEEPENIGIVW